MKLRRALGRSALATLIVTGLIASGAGTASAATATATLYAGCQDETGRWHDYALWVHGSTASPWSDFRVEYRLWGEDEWSDDLIEGPRSEYFESPGGFLFGVCVSSSSLDEDIGHDEVYFGIRVYDSAGRQRETAETNRITGYF